MCSAPTSSWLTGGHYPGTDRRVPRPGHQGCQVAVAGGGQPARWGRVRHGWRTANVLICKYLTATPPARHPAREARIGTHWHRNVPRRTCAGESRVRPFSPLRRTPAAKALAVIRRRYGAAVRAVGTAAVIPVTTVRRPLTPSG